MFTAYAVVTVVTVVANAGMALADFLRVGLVRGNMAEVDLPERSLPWLGALKGAGAGGLLLGLLGVPGIGPAAATGLVLFFVGAVAVHVRRRVFHTIAWPAGFLALAVASLALAVAVA